MLDTNICIYIIKKKPVNVLDRFKKSPVGSIGISAITLAELQYGIMKSANPPPKSGCARQIPNSVGDSRF
ncbi:PIN domain-containing protein [Proteiniphilum sp.]|uniref:PIN domain-containing protein n=1 Tax=Proteiniphilum sp. TaxID=1926877 RepID=UPI003A520E40